MANIILHIDRQQNNSRSNDEFPTFKIDFSDALSTIPNTSVDRCNIHRVPGTRALLTLLERMKVAELKIM